MKKNQYNKIVIITDLGEKYEKLFKTARSNSNCFARNRYSPYSKLDLRTSSGNNTQYKLGYRLPKPFEALPKR